MAADAVTQERTPDTSSGPAAARPRGRPRGARAAVVRDVRAIGLHHFAFLRACLLGLDLAQSFERYLAWGETTSDLRHVEARRRELLAHLVDAGRRLDLTLPEDGKIKRYVDLLANEAPAKPVVVLPTLDEWVDAQGMDPDMYSEAELLEEYRTAHGLDNVDAIEEAVGQADRVADRVRALSHLSTLLAIAPKADDKIEAWFARAIVLRLRNAGVKTLTDLFSLVNVYGHRWFAQVPGLGALRANQIVAWLRSQQDGLKLALRDGLDEPASRRALRLGTASAQLVVPRRYGIAPLEQLALPSELLGLNGVFRTHQPNTLEANDDLQAITRWLSRYAERPATFRSYRKEVERFVLWCTSVQRKAVSSVSGLDCQAYRSFLQAVPAPWCHPAPVERTDPLWRPFRGTPSPASQKQALVILQTMFEGLRDAGYLAANPMRAVMKGFALTGSKLQTQRAFGEREWAHVLRCVDDEPTSAARRRLHCLLELLVSSGVRRDELAKARRGDLRLETLPDLAPTWVLTVTGKRNKRREVPLADEVVALLDAHARKVLGDVDGAGLSKPGEGRAAGGLTGASKALGAQARLEFVDPAKRPLIFALGASVAQWQLKDGDLQAVPAVEEGGGALSGAGIYAVLKRFFARAAERAEGAGLERARFEAASTHWLRHTFVRQALVDGAPIEVVSELAGHASIDTTSIYSTQELARKITAIRGMTRRR